MIRSSLNRLFRRLLYATVFVACGAGSSLAQIDPATALLERSGWDAIMAGRIDDGARAFTAAIARDPSNARLQFGAAVAAFLESRTDQARQYAERALTIDPRFAAARELLGRVRYRAGDLPGAIREYEQLAADKPANPGVAETLARWKREADLQDRMRQQLGSHFTIRFEGAENAELASQALDVLERAYWRIGAVLSAYPLDPVQVVLYSNEQFRDVTGAPHWAAGEFDGIIRVPIRGALARSGEFQRIFSHEYTHALVRSLAPRGVPAWLNEGLAAALEANASKRAFTPGPRQPIQLPRNGFGSLDERQAAAAYATSAFAVRRLIDEHGGFAIANLLRDIGDGVDFDGAFAHRMQESLEVFEARLAGPSERD